IYYTLNPGRSDYSGSPWDSWSSGASDPQHRVAELFERLADPSKFDALVQLQPKDYAIRPGHYMMMGDNSPRSKDGRGWGRQALSWSADEREAWEVPESLLIGKAFFIYWPHGKPFGPDIRLSRDVRLPFRPYFERMKWIR